MLLEGEQKSVEDKQAAGGVVHPHDRPNEIGDWALQKDVSWKLTLAKMTIHFQQEDVAAVH